jgi:hypothetical protein
MPSLVLLESVFLNFLLLFHVTSNEGTPDLPATDLASQPQPSDPIHTSTCREPSADLSYAPTYPFTARNPSSSLSDNVDMLGFGGTESYQAPACQPATPFPASSASIGAHPMIRHDDFPVSSYQAAGAEVDCFGSPSPDPSYTLTCPVAASNPSFGLSDNVDSLTSQTSKPPTATMRHTDLGASSLGMQPNSGMRYPTAGSGPGHVVSHAPARARANPSSVPQETAQQQGGYHFGDISRSIVAKGKGKDGRSEKDGYKFGDFTRGLFK